MITNSSTFRSVVETVVPEARDLNESDWEDVFAIVEHAVAERPVAMQRQLALFLRALNVLALAKHGRTLKHLSSDKRTQLLHGLERSRLVLLRRGFWGLRTLVLMGYYARPDAKQLIGYRAHVAGWQTR